MMHKALSMPGVLCSHRVLTRCSLCTMPPKPMSMHEPEHVARGGKTTWCVQHMSSHHPDGPTPRLFLLAEEALSPRLSDSHHTHHTHTTTPLSLLALFLLLSTDAIDHPSRCRPTSRAGCERLHAVRSPNAKLRPYPSSRMVARAPTHSQRSPMAAWRAGSRRRSRRAGMRHARHAAFLAATSAVLHASSTVRVLTACPHTPRAAASSL